MSRTTQNALSGTLASLVDPKRERGARRHGGPAPRLSDAQVLEARTMHERHGTSARKVLKHFGIEETLGTHTWMRNILSYRTRSSRTNPLDPSITK